MTQPIPSLDTSSATGSNRKFFDMLQANLGFVPNMTCAMAEFPPVLEGYMSLSSALSKGSLGMTSPLHRQVSAF